MARIVFGVMGDAMGHITFSSIVASLLADHEFLFMGGGKIGLIESMGYKVVELPMLSTYYADNQVDLKKTVENAARILVRRGNTLCRVKEVMKEFSPHVVLSNYEYFTPLAAHQLNIPSVSVDHQHILTQFRWPIDPGWSLGRLLLTLPLTYMYSNAQKYLVSSFFRLEPVNPEKVQVVPSVLRPIVQEFVPHTGEHILVYQTSPSFLPLLERLKELPSQFVVYGFGKRESSGNLTFKANSTSGFLSDLSGCKYAIVNGGHNVISESLYYGKPILCFTIRLAYEQFLNAFMIKHLGYGDYSLSPHPDIQIFREFEEKLAFFRSNVSRGTFFGNHELRDKLREIIADA